jgi:hypothetical protein
MTSLEKSKQSVMRMELEILLRTLCDGLRQEVRQRHLTHLVTGQDFSLIDEREAGMAASLASHLRLVGFVVQLEAYFPSGPRNRRPDFCIWLPASKEYIYLELKTTAWGSSDEQYYYQGAINDIKKLYEDQNPLNQQNGLVALGFSKPGEQSPGRLLDGFRKILSQKVTTDYPYEEIGLECIDLQGMDERSSYAVIGLWFRKLWGKEIQ